MDFSIISKDIMKISNFLENKRISDLRKYVDTLSYERKESEVYKCYTHLLTEADYKILFDTLNLQDLIKMINRIYKTDYKITGIGEVVKMQKGDFLATHTDGFHKIQGVFYLAQIDNNSGGKFLIEDKEIFPQLGDFIIFNGNTEHSVSEVEFDDFRISITFGLV